MARKKEQEQAIRSIEQWPGDHRDFAALARILKKKSLTRCEQILEAAAIYEWLIARQSLAEDLIRRSVKIIDDKVEAADARVDLHRIARELAGVAGRSNKARWQIYQPHFNSSKSRKKFFNYLHKLTRRIASAVLVTFCESASTFSAAKLRKFAKRLPSARVREIRQPRRNAGSGTNLGVAWNPLVLPESVAPYVLRLTILHPGVLEYFLPRFFLHASDCFDAKSTFRRASFILNTVPQHGWSAEKHTKNLIEQGSLEPSEKGSEVETVKKFIRDLRSRHRKYVQRVVKEANRLRKRASAKGDIRT